MRGVTDDVDPDVLAWDETVWRTASRNRTFMLPDVMSERLDDLVQRLEVSGVRVTRAEIVGALLLAASTEPDELDRLLRVYRRAVVADAYVGEREGSGLRLRTAHPGPRPRKA